MRFGRFVFRVPYWFLPIGLSRFVESGYWIHTTMIMFLTSVGACCRRTPGRSDSRGLASHGLFVALVGDTTRPDPVISSPRSP